MSIAAFDGGEFVRYRYVVDAVQPSERLRQLAFYSPLGAGVVTDHYEELRAAILENTRILAQSFGIPSKRVLYDSHSLKEKLGMSKAIAFSDQLIHGVQENLRSIFISYVVLPPKEVPSVPVGGYRCPTEYVRTEEFLRNLVPMFAYLTTWSFLSRPDVPRIERLFIDDFRSKHTPAWSDLTTLMKPRIYPHGDECSPLICLADIIAFLTNAKLYSSKTRLTPDGVEQCWQDYQFRTEVRFLDSKNLSKYHWISRDTIDVTPFLAHPMTFMLVDDIEKFRLVEIESEEEEPRARSESERFRKAIRDTDAFYAALAYSCAREGGLQLFDRYLDTRKVQDGDTLVYVGRESKAVAAAFQDLYDVEVLSAKELRNRVAGAPRH